MATLKADGTFAQDPEWFTTAPAGAIKKACDKASLNTGDIDYPAFVEALMAMGIRPHLVLEQAVEEGTPHTLSALEAHRQTHAYAARVFAPLAG